MCYELAEGLGFVDGNKRIAFHATMTFFLLNGGELMDEEIDVDGMDRTMRTLSKRSYEEVAGWFRTFVKNIQASPS